MATLTTEELENQVNKRMEENKMEEKKNTFISKAVGKIVEVKDYIVDDIKSNPEYYKGAAVATVGGLLGVYLAHKHIKRGLTKNAFTDIQRTPDGDVTEIVFGYTGLFGKKHPFFIASNTNEQVAAFGKAITAVAEGQLTSHHLFKERRKHHD